MEFERTERTVVSYKQKEEAKEALDAAIPLLEKVVENPGVQEALGEEGLTIKQPLCIAPGQEIIVKHTVVDTYEREALCLLLDRGYVVYKIGGGKATLD